ncbi:hypothetical protein NIES2135_09810 [Leptolyngbya boryana NIES-2135]|jgi:phage host-nuclease inhibitor protein Gam|uniref:Dynamin family protein n=1 Tax=Leptolyngbya boryana NIES-2135 TaxID=1973484 RepID=A0A1Z4JCH3_LEPBY|nr:MULTISPECIES: GTPase domain-containing protein [Leptolyngbya]BAY54167.1 hypothetical protein NIES2135_09810 [Leptolyngbya boryana NIES-2135]MBD2371000.1 GTPase domain-containing protein [Leptolyngbya sp. FACHB-161]MBD2377542.1 GTPase domain-containing protein [Leptolyngbya sp. FACHB-238]MBD2401950.1 GTPase domain-containing protein [Leptolyngbya sp. FACHB-239]MBD2408468.1 GTPase domain-containing protein [Leptolyngbya sp. FACHB-402]
MSRAEKIEQIIAKRQPLVAIVESNKANLITLSTSLESLQERCSQLLTHRTEVEISKGLRKKLDELRSEIATAIADLDRLMVRFKRPTLNIGVIGRARQGKSRLLRSLTGLSEVEIPDSRGEFCTGARSKILHSDSTESATGQAYFYSEQDFLQEVIHPYYTNLSLGELPATLDALKEIPALPENKQTLSGRALYGHLRKTYVKQLDDYRPLFLKGDIPITAAEIRDYVTQDQTNDQGKPILNYLAVREVVITCRFPQADIGKIALVDLPGIGDINYVDEERLTNTLRQDVDFVLFVRMPGSKGDSLQDFDVQLYEKARESLKELPIQLWSMMVLNWVKGDEKTDNFHLCEKYISRMDEFNIEVSDRVIADCDDSREAQTKVLDPVLDYLAHEIEALDKQYAQSCQAQLDQLQRKVLVELEKASTILVQADLYQIFQENFETFWKRDLPGALEDFIIDKSRKRKDSEAQFKAKVANVIKKCQTETRLPSSVDVKITRDYHESFNTAYNSYLPRLRADLARQFLSLDGQFQDYLETVKSELTDVLVKKAKLKGLSSAKGSQFFQDVLERIRAVPGAEAQFREIQLGFETLSVFNVSYAGIIQRQVRAYLDKLTPDESEVADLKPITSSQIHEQVLEIVKSASPEAVKGLTFDHCLEVIKQAFPEPSPVPSNPSGETIAFTLSHFLKSSDVLVLWQLPVVKMMIEFGLERLKSAIAQSPEVLPSPRVIHSELLEKDPDVDRKLPIEQIEATLKLLRDRTIDGCDAVLQQMLHEPNEVAYVMVREFVDRVLRAESAEREWNRFLHREQIHVWEELRQIETRANQQQEWQKLVDAAKHHASNLKVIA